MPKKVYDKLYFINQCKEYGLPEFELELYLLKPRRFRCDLVNKDYNIVVEFEGMGGGHQTIWGFRSDVYKYNLLAMRGYFLVRITADTVANGDALKHTIRAFRLRGWEDPVLDKDY